jgi:hypothetical protein
MKQIKTKVLYVNHKKQRCGVYEFGRDIGNLLLKSYKFDVCYVECDSLFEFKREFKVKLPNIVIWNFHPITMPWVSQRGRFSIPLKYKFSAIHIGTIHEVYQELADEIDNNIFDFHIAPDPTLMLKNSIVFKTGRLLPAKVLETKDVNTLPIIGSFGFATKGKGFEKIIDIVQDEFDEALIKLNIPFAKFGDTNGKNAKEIAALCRKRINKAKISLEINHDYLDRNELISFLSSNSINVFLYDDMEKRGISSALDWALASRRPIAISNSSLFRHLFNCKPSICINDNSLKCILENGTKPVEKLYQEYSPEVILWEYENILEKIILKITRKKIKSRTTLRYYLKKIYLKFFSSKFESPKNKNIWTKPEDKFIRNEVKENTIVFKTIPIDSNNFVNRILDNEARKLYSPVIDFLFEQFPSLMKKKIKEANVQQAFVLDTTIRFSQQFVCPNILAVGSYEDTAVEALKLLNYDIYEIDPILNYDLNTFKSKPNIKEGSFDLIISTSVIEHVQDDEQFMRDVEYLLKNGGYAILTCDYKDQYIKGEEIPAVDLRFYTQKDIRERILKAVPTCKLVGTSNWDCENPDFIYDGKYNYTFASIVIQKLV